MCQVAETDAQKVEKTTEEKFEERKQKLTGKTVSGVMIALKRKPVCFIKWNDSLFDNVFIPLCKVKFGAPTVKGMCTIVKCTIEGIGRGASWDTKYPFTSAVQLIKRVPSKIKGPVQIPSSQKPTGRYHASPRQAYRSPQASAGRPRFINSKSPRSERKN